MEETINDIIRLAERETAAMDDEEKVFVYNEVANRMAIRASEVMMAAYEREED